MYEILEKLLKERGITSYRIAKDTGLNSAMFTSWKQGKYTPKQDKLQKIADYFGVSVDYLMTGSDPAPPPSSSPYQHDKEFVSYIERLWALPKERKENIYRQIRFEEDDYKKKLAEARKKRCRFKCIG